MGRCVAAFRRPRVKIKTVYGDIGGANLLDWPITLAEMEPWYAKAEFKMGTTRTNGIPGLPGSNNFKVMEAGARKLGYTQVHTGCIAARQWRASSWTRRQAERQRLHFHFAPDLQPWKQKPICWHDPRPSHGWLLIDIRPVCTCV